jgi:hypothetical protein
MVLLESNLEREGKFDFLVEERRSLIPNSVKSCVLS